MPDSDTARGVFIFAAEARLEAQIQECTMNILKQHTKEGGGLKVVCIAGEQDTRIPHTFCNIASSRICAHKLSGLLLLPPHPPSSPLCLLLSQPPNITFSPAPALIDALQLCKLFLSGRPNGILLNDLHAKLHFPLCQEFGIALSPLLLSMMLASVHAPAAPYTGLVWQVRRHPAKQPSHTSSPSL